MVDSKVEMNNDSESYASVVNTNDPKNVQELTEYVRISNLNNFNLFLFSHLNRYKVSYKPYRTNFKICQTKY